MGGQSYFGHIHIPFQKLDQSNSGQVTDAHNYLKSQDFEDREQLNLLILV